MPTRLPHRGCGGGGHTRRHDHHTIHKTHPPYTPLSTIKGAAHFDTHHVGCVEGRVARPTPTRSPHHSPNPSTIHTTHNHQGGSSLRHPSCGVCGRESCQALWGGGHPRQHDHATVHNTHPPYTPLTTIKLAAHFDTHHVGCAEGRIARRCVWGGAPAPTRQTHHSHNPSTIQRIHKQYGGSSLRHPSCGVCGRESCQALWGGGHPRQHDKPTIHKTHSPYNPLTTIKGGSSLRHPSCGVCGRESCQAHANTITPPFTKPIHHTHHSQPSRGQLTSTPIMWGVWKGELPGVVGGRAPAPTRQTLHSRNPSTIHNIQKQYGGSSLRHPSCMWGVWKGELPGVVGGRAPAPTQPTHRPHNFLRSPGEGWTQTNLHSFSDTQTLAAQSRSISFRDEGRNHVRGG